MIHWKQGDTIPLDASLPVDLSEATEVEMVLRERNGQKVFRDSAFVDDAPTGGVVFRWDDEQADKQGAYEVEWVVTWTTGEVETFPQRNPTPIHFRE